MFYLFSIFKIWSALNNGAVYSPQNASIHCPSFSKFSILVQKFPKFPICSFNHSQGSRLGVSFKSWLFTHKVITKTERLFFNGKTEFQNTKYKIDTQNSKTGFLLPLGVRKNKEVWKPLFAALMEDCRAKGLKWAFYLARDYFRVLNVESAL